MDLHTTSSTSVAGICGVELVKAFLHFVTSARYHRYQAEVPVVCQPSNIGTWLWYQWYLNAVTTCEGYDRFEFLIINN